MIRATQSVLVSQIDMSVDKIRINVNYCENELPVLPIKMACPVQNERDSELVSQVTAVRC